MKRSRLNKEKYKVYSLRRKWAPGSSIGPSPVLKKINRPQPVKLPIYEKELKVNFSSEGNHLQQKDDEDVIEGRGQVLAPASSRTWQLQPHSSGFIVKDTGKRL